MSDIPTTASPVTSAPLDSRAMPPFAYQRLNSDQFRILHLAPGSKDDALIGDLVVDIMNNEALEYDALSYMWGDPTPTGTIYLSGKALPIASNLTTALKYLRCSDKPLLVWVDAICINQMDLEERATQVQLMRRLFSRAAMVRIWINEPNIDATSKAIAALKDFHQVAGSTDEGVGRLGEDPAFWDPVAPIFLNDYWNRAWVGTSIYQLHVNAPTNVVST